MAADDRQMGHAHLPGLASSINDIRRSRSTSPGKRRPTSERNRWLIS